MDWTIRTRINRPYTRRGEKHNRKRNLLSEKEEKTGKEPTF